LQNTGLSDGEVHQGIDRIMDDASEEPMPSSMIETSEMLRADPAADWERIVREATWVVPPGIEPQGLDWLAAWQDF
jgi:hypothetical protein